MTEIQWQLAKRITAHALEREPSTRSAFIEDACASKRFLFPDGPAVPAPCCRLNGLR
jgi:hypothetical protein